jgi:hypothetical protein
LRELGEGQGRESKIKSAEPQRRQRDGEAYGGGNQGAQRESQPERPAEMDLEQAGAIGADAEHRGIGKGKLPRISHQDVEPDRQQDVDQDRVGDEQVVGVEESRSDRGEQQHRYEHVASTEERHDQTRRSPVKPSNPVGRTTSTNMMTMNAETSIKLEWR